MLAFGWNRGSNIVIATMPNVLSLDEYKDILEFYIQSGYNGREAARNYADRFPARRNPGHIVFQSTYQRFRDTGSVNLHVLTNRQLNEERQQQVLDLVRREPTISTRRIQARLQIPRNSAHAIIQREGLHPYHYRPAHELIEADYDKRMEFSRWYLRMCNNDNDFGRKILFTDEASFTRDGVFNYHNNHYYAYENPHLVREQGYQHQFRLNAWAGVFDDIVIGPVFLPLGLTSAIYLDLIVNELPNMLRAANINIDDIWFQQDGAPPHWGRVVRNRLDEIFPNRGIGRGGPIQWPPRSPDLTIMDFFMWSWIKSRVYAERIIDVDHLRNRILMAFDYLKDHQQLLRNNHRSLEARCRTCLVEHGAHVENHLQ